ncbi:methyltransferase domain-containing protein [Microbacterium sulfonylureivorans]|uniref:methyltransferase domain-containing protein n=1 Tax=Microbacterium sulfonylureivorans TaxID=2486854 RepID=UPI000FDC8E68|nr:methyltransferase domain-containing protein [Microbacterium sulfonylureivorans]
MSSIVAFGAGGDEPYALLLGGGGGGGGGRLALRKVGDVVASIQVDVDGWRAPANAADLTVLAGLEGPLLDVGCGPGRMVRAAEERGLAALGIDISTEAAVRAAAEGTPVLRRSVFDRLPLEGSWSTVLLMDGNIGIGGDPEALLLRCAHLIADDGVVVVEVDADPELHDCATYTAVGEDGLESAAFPWARVGSAAAARVALRCGLMVCDAWAIGDRRFVLLRRSPTVTT